MAIAFQNATTAQIVNTGTGTINVPSSTANGDFLVVVLSVSQANKTPTISGTWTEILNIDDDPVGSGSTQDCQLRIWYRRASSEPASYTITLNTDSFASFAVMSMMRFTGVLVSGNPIRSTGTLAYGTLGSHTSSSAAGVQSGDLGIHAMATARSTWGTSATYTLTGPGGSWTQRVNTINTDSTSGDPKPGLIVVSQPDTGAAASFTVGGADAANIASCFGTFALIPEPTGINYSDTPSDAEGLTDSLGTVQEFNNSVADPEGLTDSLNTVQTFPQSLTDSLGLTDSLTPRLDMPVTASDSLGLTDSVNVAIVLDPATPSDAMGLTDDLTIDFAQAIEISDAMGLVDAMDDVFFDPNAVEFSDALATTDNIIQALSMANTISDDLGTTDLISITLGYWEGDHVPHSSPGFGEIYIDRFFLVEKEKATESNDGKLSIAGQESSPPTTVSLVTFLHGQVVGLQEGKVVPVIFRDKSERNAYYEIGNTSSDLTDYQSGVYGDNTVATADWTIELTRLGSDSEIDLQSRLTGAVRLNDFSLTGQKWHAPAVGHYAYYTGSTNPTAITRITSDGDMTVYLGIPNNTSPKWGCAVSDYHKGRVRILDTREVTIENEVEGLNRNISATGWSLMNGLINVSPTATAGVINIANYDGTSFYDRNVNITVGGTGSANNVAQWTSATIIRNDFEQCIIRLTSPQDTVGRTTVDLSLKRGSRIVEGYVQTGSSTTISIHNVTSESGYITNAAASGYVVRSSADENGMRFVAGSARTFTSHTNGGVSKSSSTFLDFWFGAVVAPETLNSNPTFVSDVTGWSGASATVAWSTAQVHPLASGSMKVTPAGGVSAVSARSDLTGVDSITPGQTYLISGWFYSPGGWNGLYPAAQWADSSGNILSSSGTTRNVSSGTWTYLEDTVTAPASASQVRMTARADNTPTSSDVYYVWNLRIHESTPTGDAATDLRNQYIGSMPEVVYAVRR